MKETGRWKMRFTIVVCLLMAAAVVYRMRIVAPPQLLAAPTVSEAIEPDAVVGVVRSERETAVEIELDEIRALVREAVERAGGLAGLIDNGDTVVLKPNLITDYDMTYQSRDLPQDVNGMTTDWRVTQAVVELVRELNPNGQVVVLEGVANGTTSGNMETLGYVPDQISGVDDFVHLEDRSGGWREWDSPLLVAVTLPDGVGLYPDRLKVNRAPEFYLNRLYYEADVVISLPVLKNHSLSGITGAVKNVGIGATPTNIYGPNPNDNHRFIDDTIDHRPVHLHQWIHDYYVCRPVDFAIMDGLQGSLNGPVGQGSTNLAAAQQNMRLILASRDAVALDTIASLIMQYDPARIPHLVTLHNDGFGCVDPSRVRVEGIEPSEVRKRFSSRFGGTAFYRDLSAPGVTIESCAIEGGVLLLSLTADEDIAKVEISIDGVRLDRMVVGGFDDIRLPLGARGAGNHAVTIHVYDKYLNLAVKQIEVEAAS